MSNGAVSIVSCVLVFADKMESNGFSSTCSGADRTDDDLEDEDEDKDGRGDGWLWLRAFGLTGPGESTEEIDSIDGDRDGI